MNFERRFLRLDFIFEVQKSRSRICSFTLKVKKLERLLRKKVQFKLFHFLIVCINAYWQNLENSPKKFPKIYFFQKSGISKKQVIRFQPNENMVVQPFHCSRLNFRHFISRPICNLKFPIIKIIYFDEKISLGDSRT